MQYRSKGRAVVKLITSIGTCKLTHACAPDARGLVEISPTVAELYRSSLDQQIASGQLTPITPEAPRNVPAQSTPSTENVSEPEAPAEPSPRGKRARGRDVQIPE
jgi:hypothetical protein